MLEAVGHACRHTLQDLVGESRIAREQLLEHRGRHPHRAARLLAAHRGSVPVWGAEGRPAEQLTGAAQHRHQQVLLADPEQDLHRPGQQEVDHPSPVGLANHDPTRRHLLLGGRLGQAHQRPLGHALEERQLREARQLHSSSPAQHRGMVVAAIMETGESPSHQSEVPPTPTYPAPPFGPPGTPLGQGNGGPPQRCDSARQGACRAGLLHRRADRHGGCGPLDPGHDGGRAARSADDPSVRRSTPSWWSCAPATWAWTCAARWSPRPRRSPAAWTGCGGWRRPAPARWCCRRCSKNSSPLRPARSPGCWKPGRRAVGGAGPGRLQRRAVRLPGAGREGQGHPPDPGDRQPQRGHPRRLGGARRPAGGGRRRRGGAQRLLRLLQPRLGGSEVEWRYLELVRSVRQAIGIPLAVKLNPNFSSVANLTRQLVEAGANGLVLFNRFYQPDLDLETLEVTPRLVLSTSEELRLPLRWIAILYRQLPASLAASTGVHTAADAIKVLMAGADVAMMTSALLRHGPEHLTVVEAGLREWLEGRGMPSVDLLRGLRSQRSVRDPAAWERANYITMLASYPDQVHTEARCRTGHWHH